MKRFWFPMLISFCLSVFLLPIHFAFAADFSSVYAIPTTHLASASANYKFYLTVDDSASFVGGETLTITFPTGYSLSSFSEDDIDVADDGVDFTTASDCSGSEEMGISVSGTAVTFEMCAGDGGSVASDSVLEIEMGLSASSSGTGTRQVTNPSGAGSYFIALSGTFGDNGSIIVPIVLSSGSGVSVEVSEPSSGGGGGGGGGGGSSSEDEDEDEDEDEEIPEDGDDSDSEPEPEPDEPEPEPEPEDSGDDTSEDPAADDSGNGNSGDDSSAQESVDDSDLVDSDGSETSEDILYDVDVSADDIVLPIIADTVDVLANTSPYLRIFIEDGDVDRVSFDVDGISYPFSEIAENVWGRDIPVGASDAAGTLALYDPNGEVVQSPLSFHVISSGSVYEIFEDQPIGVGDAVVTVFTLDGFLWDAERYGQSSSLVTNASGSGFAWYVPSGTYLVRVEKEGYERSETTVTVIQGVLAPTLHLSRILQEELPVGSLDEPQVAEGELPVDGDFLTDASTSFREDFSHADALITFAGLGAFVSIFALGGGRFLLLLSSFFSQPLLFFTRKKTRHVSVVYHGVTKVPLDLVTVRVYDVKANRLVKTVVTNSRGEFFLRLTRPGLYRLHAIKSGFLFPSTFLQGFKEDGVYHDVYTGQYINISEHAEPLAISLPLDPEVLPASAKVLRRHRTRQRIALFFSPLSVFLSFFVVLFSPGILSVALFCLQIILYFLIWRLAHRKRPAHWGVVYDAFTRRPVGNVVIRLFEPKYNKLVDSILSDAQGRYAFALGPNEYYATFVKDGYLETTVKPIDFKTRKEVSLFGIDLPLRRLDTSHE